MTKQKREVDDQGMLLGKIITRKAFCHSCGNVIEFSYRSYPWLEPSGKSVDPRTTRNCSGCGADYKSVEQVSDRLAKVIERFQDK